ncbi:hypothetical protein HY404_03080 [Candidatus Microgenomates bacterium]|nr:hypothetical protein [Candidatus Microgenomates bacterium]
MEIETFINKEVLFYRSLAEDKEFCCSGCGSKAYRVILSAEIPVDGRQILPEDLEIMRLCNICIMNSKEEVI